MGGKAGPGMPSLPAAESFGRPILQTKTAAGV